MVYFDKFQSIDVTADTSELLNMLYPYSIILEKEGYAAVLNILKSFHVNFSDKQPYLKVLEKKKINSENCVLYINNNSAFEV